MFSEPVTVVSATGSLKIIDLSGMCWDYPSKCHHFNSRELPQILSSWSTTNYITTLLFTLAPDGNENHGVWKTG
jgi:hypothetical protein